MLYFLVFFFKQKTAYEMRISDWSSDVCSSDLEKVDGRLQLCTEAILVPRQEQLALDERVDDPAQALHRGARHAPVVEEAAGDPGGGGVEVQHVVAEVAQQHRLFAADGEHEIGRASCRDRVCQYV